MACAHFERRGVRLPEVLHAHRKPARHVAGEHQPARAASRDRIQPAALRIGPLLDREPIGRSLRQLEIVPHRPIGEQFLPRRVEGLLVGDALSRKLVRIRRALQLPPPRRRLHRLRPQSVAFARESHVAIVYLLAHRHGEGEAEPVDEVLRVVAVEDDRVHQAHGLGAAVEVQAHRERQPLARVILMHAFDLDHRAHRPALLHRDLLDVAGELGEAQDAGRRTVFQRADQASVARHHAPVDSHRLDKCRPLLRNAALQLAGVDIDCLRRLRDLDAGPRGRRSRCEAERTARARDRGEPGELDRSVRPIGQRPRLQRQRLAVVRRQRKRLRTSHRSTRPRHAPTDSGLDPRRRAAQPSDRHRPVSRWRLLLHRCRRGGARQNSNCTTSRNFHRSPHCVSHASLQRRVASALQSMCGSSDTGPSYPMPRSARKCAA